MATVEEFATLMWQRFINQERAYTYMWYHDGKKGYSKPVKNLCGNKPVCSQCKYGRCTNTENLPLEFSEMLRHVKGEQTLAPYQLSDENTVKYLEFDIDIVKNSGKTIEDAQKQVLELAYTITSLFGARTFMVEISGSKGYHIWMFFSDQIAARFAYALGHYIRGQVSELEGIEIEVFPKQVTQASYGSATRLPFGLHAETKVRGVIVDNTFTPHTDQYEVFKRVRDISEGELFDIITKKQIQVPDSIRRDAGKGYEKYLCIGRLMKEGAEEGNRDVLLYRLGCYLRDRGFDEDMALLVLQEVNARSSSPLDNYTVESKMLSAYRGDYSGMPCFRPEFDSYCSSTCPIFAKKAEWRHVSVEELKRKVRD